MFTLNLRKTSTIGVKEEIGEMALERIRSCCHYSYPEIHPRTPIPMDTFNFAFALKYIKTFELSQYLSEEFSLGNQGV